MGVKGIQISDNASPAQWFELVFWIYYPRKQNGAGAKQKFIAIASGKHRYLKASSREICEGAYRYSQYCKNKPVQLDYIKLPTTWLNNGCWADELPYSNNITTAVNAEGNRRTRDISIQEQLSDISWASD